MDKIKSYFLFFPLQLFFLHFKKNLPLMLIWGLIFGFVTKQFAMSLGIPYLFLSPEYLNEVGVFSYFIVGFALGGFFMAFHLYSYLTLGPSFPFIVTLARPFYKFCINNSLIPLLFLIVFIRNIYTIEYYEDLRNLSEIHLFVISLLFGVVIFLTLAMFYFRMTNKNSEKIVDSKDNLVKSFFIRPSALMPIGKVIKYKPKYYLKGFVHIKATRDVDHYNQAMFEKVMKQNHFNASLFEILVVLSFITIGLFQSVEIFLIPASASILLLFTLLIMIFSIIYSWFHRWSIVVLICLAVLFNYLSSTSSIFSIKSFAYGLDYTHIAPYSLKEIKSIQFNDSVLTHDILRHKEILAEWKKKAKIAQDLKKPKLIIINASGGGLRAALWTFNVMQKLNTAFDGKFIKSTHLITGASGGMLGGAYFRELYFQTKGDNDLLNNPTYIDNMGNDLLNNLSFNLVTNDLFLRRHNFTYQNRNYKADRGHIFEQDLNKSTAGILNKSLGDYKRLEALSLVPLVVLTPTIVNDGRRLVIGSQPYGFLNGTDYRNKDIGPENVEFIKLFKNNDPMAVSYLSALRMNATFPFVLPMVNLPTKPEIVAMDAGIRDNYGIKTTLQYIKAFENWLIENTSGVILVEIRDINKDYDMVSKAALSIKDRLLLPVGNFYGNYLHAQEYNASELFDFANQSDLQIDKISFLLRKSPQDEISLSWHLTELEKLKIKNTFENAINQKELLKLIHLLR
ncbi:MAG: hypothetical protein AB8B74_08860 [Crocinitomicaceae bacterium]